MTYPYLTWLLLFFALPTVVLWVFFFKHLARYWFAFLSLIGFSLVFGVAWDYFAIWQKIWGWPESCCTLPRVHGLPLEELLFISLAALYVGTMTIVGRDIYLNYVKSKLNAICTELLEVYSYMRAITATGYILA